MTVILNQKFLINPLNKLKKTQNKKSQGKKCKKKAKRLRNHRLRVVSECKINNMKKILHLQPTRFQPKFFRY